MKFGKWKAKPDGIGNKTKIGLTKNCGVKFSHIVLTISKSIHLFLVAKINTLPNMYATSIWVEGGNGSTRHIVSL